MISRYLLSCFAAAVVLPAMRAATPSGSPPNTYRFQRATIIDRQGFGRPLTAASLLIPAGWNSEGGIVWQINNSGCGKNGTRFEWHAVAPDGTSAVEILPEETWTGNNLPIAGMQQTCPNITITTVKDFLSWYVQRHRPNARILDYRARPDLVKKLQQFNRTDNTLGGQMETRVECGEALLGYSLNNQEVREAMSVATVFYLSRMQGVFPGEIREFLTLSVLPGFAVRAPNGELDFRLVETIRRSIQPGAEWSAAMAQHNAKIAQINLKGAADRHAIQQKTFQEIAEINQQGYENRQAIMDRSHERFSQAIRGVDTFVDSSSNEQVELPNTYDNVWRLNDGTYLLTDDPNFQPGTDLGVDGHQLERQNP